MNRGYAGFYKNHYLRSSYEYAYAVYLDHFAIPWSYEDQIFKVDGRSYKPDFFFYDQYGELEKIVEIKSRNKNSIERAKKRLKFIEEKLQIKTELISYEELLSIYQEMPVSLNYVITKWITSDKTTIHKAANGHLNGHYGLRHSEEAKRRIGQHTKMLWNSDSSAKMRMIEGLRKTGLVQKGKIKTPRENRSCRQCSMEFSVMITSTQIYCSRECSGKVAIKLATEANVENRKSIHNEIRSYILQWTFENKDLVLSTPFNKINSTMKPMTDEIYRKYNVKDFRVISCAVFGIDRGRKELLRFMKKMCNENVC